MTPTPSTQALIVQRRHMVDGQLRVGGVTDLSLLGAFLDTPRESFVAPAQAALAYLDCDQPALGSSGRRLLAPLTRMSSNGPRSLAPEARSPSTTSIPA